MMEALAAARPGMDRAIATELRLRMVAHIVDRAADGLHWWLQEPALSAGLVRDVLLFSSIPDTNVSLSPRLAWFAAQQLPQWELPELACVMGAMAQARFPRHMPPEAQHSVLPERAWQAEPYFNMDRALQRQLKLLSAAGPHGQAQLPAAAAAAEPAPAAAGSSDRGVAPPQLTVQVLLGVTPFYARITPDLLMSPPQKTLGQLSLLAQQHAWTRDGLAEGSTAGGAELVQQARTLKDVAQPLRTYVHDILCCAAVCLLPSLTHDQLISVLQSLAQPLPPLPQPPDFMRQLVRQLHSQLIRRAPDLDARQILALMKLLSLPGWANSEAAAALSCNFGKPEVSTMSFRQLLAYLNALHRQDRLQYSTCAAIRNRLEQYAQRQLEHPAQRGSSELTAVDCATAVWLLSTAGLPSHRLMTWLMKAGPEAMLQLRQHDEAWRVAQAGQQQPLDSYGAPLQTDPTRYQSQPPQHPMLLARLLWVLGLPFNARNRKGQTLFQPLLRNAEAALADMDVDKLPPEALALTLIGMSKRRRSEADLANRFSAALAGRAGALPPRVIVELMEAAASDTQESPSLLRNNLLLTLAGALKRKPAGVLASLSADDLNAVVQGMSRSPQSDPVLLQMISDTLVTKISAAAPPEIVKHLYTFSRAQFAALNCFTWAAQSLAAQDLAGCGPQELSQLATAYVTAEAASGPGTFAPLVSLIVRKVEESLPSFTLRQLVLLTPALMRLGAEQRVQDAVRAALVERRQEIADQDIHEALSEFATLSTASMVYEPAVWDAYAGLFTRELFKLLPKTTYWIALRFGSAGHRHDGLIDAFYATLRPRLRDIPYQGIHSVLMLLRLRKDPSFFDALAESFAARLDDLHGNEVVRVLNAFSAAGHHHQGLFRAGAAVVRKQLLAIQPQYLGEVMTSLAAAGHLDATTLDLVPDTIRCRVFMLSRSQVQTLTALYTKQGHPAAALFKELEGETAPGLPVVRGSIIKSRNHGIVPHQVLDPGVAAPALAAPPSNPGSAAGRVFDGDAAVAGAVGDDELPPLMYGASDVVAEADEAVIPEVASDSGGVDFGSAPLSR